MNNKPLDDVWASRDLPVLVEVARRIDQGDSPPTIDDIAIALDMAPDDVALAGAALRRRNLVKVISAAEIRVVRFMDVSAEAYFLTGLHPSGDDAVTNLVAALRQAADQVDDPDEKSRLRTFADQALGISRNVLGGVLTAVISHQING